jgi:hypothetical protein
MIILLCRQRHYHARISPVQSRSLGRVSLSGEGKTCEEAPQVAVAVTHTGHSPECQTAVSETRDLRGGVLIFYSTTFFLTMALRKELLSQLTHRGFICHPFPSAVGKVPGGAEYVTLYVYATESVCL